jgi:membrane protein YdbS with pleckstrin-like domain
MSATPPPPPPSGPPAPPPPATAPVDGGPAPLVPEGDQALAPPVLTLWRAGLALTTAVLLLPALVVAAAVGGAVWLVPAVVLVGGGAQVALLPTARYRRWRWRMTSRALVLEHGVLVRRVRALPYFRIQHIDLEHGPLDRRLGLARLEVHTASVTATLPGLASDQAPGIRAALLQLAADAVTGDHGDDAV